MAYVMGNVAPLHPVSSVADITNQLLNLNVAQQMFSA